MTPVDFAPGRCLFAAGATRSDCACFDSGAPTSFFSSPQPKTGFTDPSMKSPASDNSEPSVVKLKPLLNIIRCTHKSFRHIGMPEA